MMFLSLGEVVSDCNGERLFFIRDHAEVTAEVDRPLLSHSVGLGLTGGNLKSVFSCYCWLKLMTSEED